MFLFICHDLLLVLTKLYISTVCETEEDGCVSVKPIEVAVRFPGLIDNESEYYSTLLALYESYGYTYGEPHNRDKRQSGRCLVLLENVFFT